MSAKTSLGYQCVFFAVANRLNKLIVIGYLKLELHCLTFEIRSELVTYGIKWT